MIVISSSAYVISEFQAELGKIPPCLLPLGNKKVLEHQVSILKEQYPLEKIIVSLPQTYELTETDKNLILDLNLVYVSVPDDFSLSESVGYVLNVTSYDIEDQFVRIIYGDTLVYDLPNSNLQDILGLSFSEDSYNWKVESFDDNNPYIWCGFYSFSSRRLLLRCLALERYNFIEAVELYRKDNPLCLHFFNKWFDLGHVNTYFQSRATITTQRAFNELQIQDGILKKTGKPAKKIEAEAQWFLTIPSQLKKFTPQLLDYYTDDRGNYFYSLEYLPHMPLNELFVHGRNNPIEWGRFFKLISNFLNVAAHINISLSQCSVIQKDFENLICKKTYSRLQEYADQLNVDFNSSFYYENKELPTLNIIISDCIDKILALPKFSSISHGDLCLSNILYDARSHQIKVIDPRGINSTGDLTIFGDQKYDLAKLAHSIIGLYDHIIAGRYKIINENTNYISIQFDIDQRILDIQNIFNKITFLNKLSGKDILPLVILLFLSMLPLHRDRPDRQKAMFYNALRLYSLF